MPFFHFGASFSHYSFQSIQQMRKMGDDGVATLSGILMVMMMASAADADWCVSRSSATAEELQTALNYACSSGGDCSPIQPNGLCFLPNNLQAHASYAFNSYYQRCYRATGSCNFAGTATISVVDPSRPCSFCLVCGKLGVTWFSVVDAGYGMCTYPSSAGYSSLSLSLPPPPSRLLSISRVPLFLPSWQSLYRSFPSRLSLPRYFPSWLSLLLFPSRPFVLLLHDHSLSLFLPLHDSLSLSSCLSSRFFSSVKSLPSVLFFLYISITLSLAACLSLSFLFLQLNLLRLFRVLFYISISLSSLHVSLSRFFFFR